MLIFLLKSILQSKVQLFHTNALTAVDSNIRVQFCPLVADVYTRISNLYLTLGLHCKACSSPCKTSGPCQQHLSLSIIFCAFCLVADVNTRVSNPISYTWVAIQGLSNTLKPADPPALYKCKYRQGANKAPSLV